MANTSLIKNFGPKYLDWLVKGYIHHAATARGGLAMVIYSATANFFALWNPQGSGKLFIPLKLRANIAGSTTLVNDSCPSWYKVVGAGSAIATGGPISAWTDVASTQVHNAMVGMGNDPSIKFSVAQTVAAAPTLIGTTGLLTTNVYANTAVNVMPTSIPPAEYDGEISALPGNALLIGGSTLASGAAFALDLCFAVVPLSELSLNPV